MKHPLVSVIVTTYNHKDYIAQCLDSILIQKTTFSFEIILGEDESTDGTREICMAYTNKYPDKIQLFLRSRKDVIYINGNPTGRYNFIESLKAAKGKYIALCEGDDYWTNPLKLQKQVDFLENNLDYGICFHNVNILNQRKGQNKFNVMLTHLNKSIFTTEDMLEQWFVPTGSIVFRQYKDFKLPDWFLNCASGDIPLLLLLSLKGNLKYLNEIMGVYRLVDTGVSTSISHYGHLKVFSMIYIYTNFNIYTNYKFQDKINTAMVYELKKHTPEIIELEQLKKENKLLKKNLENANSRVINKLFRALKKVVKS